MDRLRQCLRQRKHGQGAVLIIPFQTKIRKKTVTTTITSTTDVTITHDDDNDDDDDNNKIIIIIIMMMMMMMMTNTEYARRPPRCDRDQQGPLVQHSALI